MTGPESVNEFGFTKEKATADILDMASQLKADFPSGSGAEDFEGAIQDKLREKYGVSKSDLLDLEAGSNSGPKTDSFLNFYSMSEIEGVLEDAGLLKDVESPDGTDVLVA